MGFTDDDGLEKRVLVRREHYDAGMKILATAEPGNAAFAVAEERAAECKAAGDQAGVAFWGKVYGFLMDKVAAAGDAETVILEAGEEWDGENERVIGRKDPPRSDNRF
jgi:hypothetical protein